jgi:hypothetical protein
VTSNGKTYTLLLPTLTELQALYNDPLPNPPTGWTSGLGYWSATPSGSGVHSLKGLANGGQASYNDTTSINVVFQVL